MIKQSAAALALLLTVACASTSMHSSSTETGGGNAKSAVATRSVDAPEYILLQYPSQIRTIDWSKNISALHIKGTLTNRGFYPAGKIEGNGTFCASGNDWLSLADLSVHKAGDGKTPAAPYVTGCATDNGFQPASRDIVLQ